MPALVLTNILSTGVPADRSHEAILGNLKTNVDYLPPPPVWSSRILQLSSLGTDRPFHSGPISLIYWQLLPSLILGLNCMYIYTLSVRRLWTVGRDLDNQSQYHYQSSLVGRRIDCALEEAPRGGKRGEKKLRFSPIICLAKQHACQQCCTKQNGRLTSSATEGNLWNKKERKGREGGGEKSSSSSLWCVKPQSLHLKRYAQIHYEKNNNINNSGAMYSSNPSYYKNSL